MILYENRERNLEDLDTIAKNYDEEFYKFFTTYKHKLNLEIHENTIIENISDLNNWFYHYSHTCNKEMSDDEIWEILKTQNNSIYISFFINQTKSKMF